jgi:hypothetical protein
MKLIELLIYLLPVLLYMHIAEKISKLSGCLIINEVKSIHSSHKKWLYSIKLASLISIFLIIISLIVPNAMASDCPIVAISTPNTELNCTGPCPVLNSTVTDCLGPFAYLWYNNSILIPGATNSNFTACYPGTYNLSVTNTTSGCIGSSNLLVISAKADPIVTISTPDTLLNCTGVCPILNSTVTDGSESFAYQWYNNSMLIPGATDFNFTACYPGTYNLSATNTTSGCTGSSNSLVISPRDYPIVTISTPDTLLNCTGVCPILNSTVIDGSGPFAYQWYNNSMLIPGATDFNFTACYPGTYNLSVTNTTSGCTNSSNYLVLTLAAPLIIVSTPDVQLNCTGVCPILNSTVIDGSGPFAYQWYNNSILIPGATNSNFTACYPGTYNLSVTNTTSRCTNSSNLLVISPRDYPIVTISMPDTLLNCTGVCPVLNSSVIDGLGPFAYQWYNNSTLIPGATDFNFTACYPGTYNLSVTNTTSGCTNSSNLLVISPRDYPIVTISTPDTLLNCTGVCPVLNSTVIDGSGPFTYQWYNNSMLIPGATDFNFTACYPGTYNLSVINTTSRCTNSSNSLVLRLAAPLIVISTPDVQLNCTGVCPILNSTVIDGSGPFAYQWYNNSILIPGATNSNFTACYPGTYNLSVTNTTSRCTNRSNLLVISPRDHPIVTISTPDTLLNCTGVCPILNSSVIDGSGPFAYQWYNNSTLIPGATDFNFTACYPGTYNLSVTNITSRCNNSSNLLVISPRDYPIVAISTPNTLLNCTGICPILNSTVIDGTGPFAYQWYNNSILIAGATNSNFTACYPGAYNLSVTNTTSLCTNGSNSLVIIDKVCPGMALNKSDNAGGHLVGEGETITYTYEVKNVWFVDLTNVTVTDNRVSNIIGPIDPNNDGKLNPGETWIFKGSYTVKTSDLGGDIVNTAQAEAEDPFGSFVESDIADDVVSPRPPMDQPVQFEQFCEAKKVSGQGVIDSGTSIIDKELALEYNDVMTGNGDLELDQEQAYSQNSDKLKRNIDAVNGGNESNLNLFEKSSLTYSGEDPLVGGKYLNSREFYGGIGADVKEVFSASQMEKEQTTFFSTIPEEAVQKKGSNTFIGQLDAAGRNTSKSSDIMGNNSAYLIGMEISSTFNGTWGTDATWRKIFYKDIKAHQLFTGTFEAVKTIKFHENPVPDKIHVPCEGIDC